MTRQSAGPFGLAAALACGLFLSGCGGGNSLVVRAVPFEGPVTGADYIGKSFPVQILVGEAGDPSGRTRVGQGSITYDSATQITLRLPGAQPIVLTRTASSASQTTFQGTALSTPVEVIVQNFASNTAFRTLSATAGGDLALGGFGFETAVADRPATGTYAVAGAVFLTVNNVEDFLPVAGEGELVADFGAGTISGELLATDKFSVELAGSSTIADELDLMFELQNGRITSTGFAGGVTASGEINVDGGAPTALTGTVSGGSASGAFYGANASAVAGTFEGGVLLSDGATPLVDFDAAGFVSGARTGP